jgi:hypothetical protein
VHSFRGAGIGKPGEPPSVLLYILTAKLTEDGSVKALSQILFRPLSYLGVILQLYVFFRKKNMPKFFLKRMSFKLFQNKRRNGGLA